MNSTQERTLVLIKPDAVSAGYADAIRKIYTDDGLKIGSHRFFVQASRELIEAHYAAHKGRPYFEDTVSFMTSGPIWALVVSGPNAIDRVRELNGATDPLEAKAGSVRQLYGTQKSRNAVHASDSPESAQQEITLWFPSPMSHEEQQSLLQSEHG